MSMGFGFAAIIVALGLCVWLCSLADAATTNAQARLQEAKNAARQQEPKP